MAIALGILKLGSTQVNCTATLQHNEEGQQDVECETTTWSKYDRQ